MCYADMWPFSSSHCKKYNLPSEVLTLSTKICNVRICDLSSTVDLHPYLMVFIARPSLHHNLYYLFCDVISAIGLFSFRSAIRCSPSDCLLLKSSKCFCLSRFLYFLPSTLYNSAILPELYSIFKSVDLS